jgi:hypothetical protein
MSNIPTECEGFLTAKSMKPQEVLTTLQLETLLGKYIAKNGQVNPQFSKQVNLLSETDKKKVWREVKVRELDKQRNHVREQYLSLQRQAAQFELMRQAAELPIVVESSVVESSVAESSVVELLTETALSDYPDNPDDDLDDDLNDADTDDESDEKEEPTSKRRGPGRGPRIMWTEDEWEKIAETVYSMRRNRPIPALVKLVNRAMKQMPAERRRKLQGVNNLKPLIDRLLKIGVEEKTKAEEYDRYRSQIQQMGKIPTREEIISTLTDEELNQVKLRVSTLDFDNVNIAWKDKILANLTDEEILTRFSQTVLDNQTPAQLMEMVDPEVVLNCLPFPKVFGFVAEHCMESIGQFSSLFTAQPVFKQMRPPTAFKQPEVAPTRAPQAPTTPAIPKVVRVEKPKVTIIGLKGDQEQRVLQELGNRCDFTFIESDAKSKSIPDGQDVIVLWANFTSHCFQSKAKAKAKAKATNGTRLITHHGGLGEMIKTIKKVINGEIVQPTRPGSGVGVN